MKQRILLASIIVMCCMASANAQIRKGSVWVGGGLSFSNSRQDREGGYDQTEKGFSINPGIGIAIKENFVLGTEFIYHKQKREYEYNLSKYNYRDVGAGVFARQYIPIVNRFYLFAQGSVSAVGIKSSTESFNTSPELGKGWSATLGLTPGVSFAVAKYLQLESGLGNLLYYSHIKTTYKRNGIAYNTTKQSVGGINLEAMANLYIGLRFLL